MLQQTDCNWQDFAKCSTKGYWRRFLHSINLFFKSLGIFFDILVLA